MTNNDRTYGARYNMSTIVGHLDSWCLSKVWHESEDKPTNSEAAAKVDDNESENQLEVELRIYPGNHQREGRETVTKLKINILNGYKTWNVGPNLVFPFCQPFFWFEPGGVVRGFEEIRGCFPDEFEM